MGFRVEGPELSSSSRLFQFLGAVCNRAARPNIQHQIIDPTPSTLYPIPYSLYPAPYTLDPIPCSLRSRPYTIDPIPYTLHPIPYTLDPIPCSLHPRPYTIDPIPCSLHPRLYTLLPLLSSRDPRQFKPTSAHQNHQTINTKHSTLNPPSLGQPSPIP